MPCKTEVKDDILTLSISLLCQIYTYRVLAIFFQLVVKVLCAFKLKETSQELFIVPIVASAVLFANISDIAVHTYNSFVIIFQMKQLSQKLSNHFLM